MKIYNQAKSRQFQPIYYNIKNPVRRTKNVDVKGAYNNNKLALPSSR